MYVWLPGDGRGPGILSDCEAVLILTNNAFYTQSKMQVTFRVINSDYVLKCLAEDCSFISSNSPLTTLSRCF